VEVSLPESQEGLPSRAARAKRPSMPITYKDAGVDIDAGNDLVDRIRPLAKSTMRPEVLGGIGGFAALCSLPTRYREPILVSGTDGVGTKLKSAFATGRHDTIGIDLVAMCVNDVLVTGAEPLFFLDYFASGKLDVDTGAAVIGGIAEGCRQAGCALVGGETAELPGLYHGRDYDLAGFSVGVVEKAEIRPRRDLLEGDVIIGLPSAGLHSNGHTLARKVVLEVLGLAWDATPPELGGATVADELLRPTLIYAPAFRRLADAAVAWKAAAHITGGGLVENPPRFLADDALAVELDPSTWTVPGIFALIAKVGVDALEMRRTFNMGLGMIIAVAAADAARTVELLAPENARVVGRLVARGTGAPSRYAGE
jgi:phosphoribosylformylglycinamidine cyclo-ligase